MNEIQRKRLKPYYRKTVNTPLGTLQLIGSDQGLAAILWPGEGTKRIPLNIVGDDERHPVLLEAERQLNEYFSGTRTTFDLELDFTGTDFQKDVWTALLGIPFGEVRTYSDIARQIGRPSAVRAVGAANGKNPISIIAPCHRVIGVSGDLTGFAGGLAAKERLLKLENAKGPRYPGAPRQ